MTELSFKYEGILEEEGLKLSDLPVEIRKQINALNPNYSRYQKNPTEAMREALIRQDVEVSNAIYDWLEQNAIEEEEAKAKAEAEAKAKAEAEAKAKAEAEAEAKAKAEAEAKAKAEAEAKEKAEAEAKAKEEAEAKAAEEKARAEAEAKAKEEEEKAKAEAEAAEAAKKKEEEEKARAEAEAKAKEEEEIAKKVKFGTKEMAASINEKIEANKGHILISELKAIINKEPSYPHQEVYNLKLHKPYMKSYYVKV